MLLYMHQDGPQLGLYCSCMETFGSFTLVIKSQKKGFAYQLVEKSWNRDT